MPKIEIPEFDKYPEVKGVFVGGCVDRGDGSSFRARAHAHMSKAVANPGWICVRSMKRVRNKATGKITNTMIHELAHILSDDWHTLKWGRKMRELGGKLDKDRYVWQRQLK